MFVIKSLATDFSYGKPLVASAKVIQSLGDETIKNLIFKFRQALMPPLGIKVMRDAKGNPVGGKIVSKDVFAPGAMTQGLNGDSFSKLIDHNGVSDSEFKMYEIINGITEQYVGRGKFQQGLEPMGNITATQAIEMQKQAIKMLGLSVLAVIKAKRDLTMMRIYNILTNYLDPTGKVKNPMTGKLENTYRKFSLDDGNIENGKTGSKIISLTDKEMTPDVGDKLLEVEEEMEKRGKTVRYHFVNVNKLREIPMNLYVTVTQKPKDSNALDKVLFTDKLTQTANISSITGKRANPDEVTQEFERIWQSKDWFSQNPEELLAQIQQQEQQMAVGGQSQAGAQMQKGIGQTQRPSVNTMMQP
jgi:hypothetical protein